MEHGESNHKLKAAGKAFFCIAGMFLLTLFFFGRIGDHWPYSVFNSDILALKQHLAARTEKPVKEADPASTNPVATQAPPYLWTIKEVLTLNALIILSALMLSRRLVKRRLNRYPKFITHAASLLLAIPLIVFIFYGYASGRGKLLKNRFSLTPENTVVRLNYWAGLGGRRDPSRILFCGVSSEEPASSQKKTGEWKAGHQAILKPTPLATQQMAEVIDALNKDFFALGLWTGPWSYIDGVVLYISVSDGTHSSTAAGWISSSEAQRLERLYDDLIEIAEQAED